jgi:predicted lipoprotein with Yx(FWY)xxD motif
MKTTRTRAAGYSAALATLAVLAAACGGSSSGGAPASTVNPAAGGSTTGGTTTGNGVSTLRTESTSIGTVTADSQGRTIYELVGDPASNSKCASSCESIWPPVMANGKIVMLHGHPLFTFTGDTAVGQAHGQNLRDTWGRWLALNAKGAAITTSAKTAPTPTSMATAAASTPPASSGGGYGY